ncbi:MAG: MFS transporter [Pyrinomonadaceae bacterium]|nr:MFS transporter [Pyrinomonadaceae bacterium]
MTYRQLLAGNRDFRLLWSGQVVSEIGDWLNNIAVLALTLELAGPGQMGRAIALYAIARHLPLFMFGPIAGVVVDRIDRRRVMIAADVVRAALALVFLLANLWQSLTLIYTVGAAMFAVAAFFNAAKRAAIPNIVHGTEELLNANSLSASTTAATIAIGSALGGLIATFIARDLVFGLNSLTFLLSAVIIRRIHARMSQQKMERRPSELEGDGRAKVLNAGRAIPSTFRFPTTAFYFIRRAAGDFGEGLRYVRNDFTLTLIFVAAAGWGLGNGAARALYSIFGARLGESAAFGWVARPADFGISVLFVAMGLGGMMGAPVARRFSRGAGASLGARMGRSMMLDGAGLFTFSLIPNLWGAAAVLVAREMNFAIWWTAQQTIMMQRTDDRYAGRVFASYETLTTLMMVGAIYVSGLAADIYDIRVVAAAGGAIITLSGLTWFVLRRSQRSDELPRRGRGESEAEESTV